MINLGAIVAGDHPIMDGKPHHIATEGDKNDEKSGFYVTHLDCIPAGYIKNNRTGAELNWKCKGYILTDEQKTTLKSEEIEHQQTRQCKLEAKQKSTALRLKQKLSIMTEVEESRPYMQTIGNQSCNRKRSRNSNFS